MIFFNACILVFFPPRNITKCLEISPSCCRGGKKSIKIFTSSYKTSHSSLFTAILGCGYLHLVPSVPTRHLRWLDRKGSGERWAGGCSSQTACSRCMNSLQLWSRRQPPQSPWPGFNAADGPFWLLPSQVLLRGFPAKVPWFVGTKRLQFFFLLKMLLWTLPFFLWKKLFQMFHWHLLSPPAGPAQASERRQLCLPAQQPDEEQYFPADDSHAGPFKWR